MIRRLPSDPSRTDPRFPVLDRSPHHHSPSCPGVASAMTCCAPTETLRIVCVLGRQCTYASFSGCNAPGRRPRRRRDPVCCRYRCPRKHRSPLVHRRRLSSPRRCSPIPADAGNDTRGFPRRVTISAGRSATQSTVRRAPEGEHRRARCATVWCSPQAMSTTPAGELGDDGRHEMSAPPRHGEAELSPVVGGPRYPLCRRRGARVCHPPAKRRLGLPALREDEPARRRGERPRLGAGRRGVRRGRADPARRRSR